MIEDYHLHSYYSEDSDVLMEDMVRHGISLGIDELVFTEHVDYGGKPGYYIDYEKYFHEIDALNQKYPVISIKKGVEFGVQQHLVERYERDYEQIKDEIDYIILSVHDIENQNLYDGIYQKGKTQEETHKGYYEAFYQLVKSYKNYSVLGHFDLIKRYDKEADYPDSNIMEIVEKIFEIVISEGKGLEINTSSYKYRMSDSMPSRALLKKFYDMGGRIVTIGSDAHDLVHMGDHMEETKMMLKEIGFTEFCTFEKQKPVFWPL